MTAKVANFIIQTLCDDQGSLDFGVLTRKLEQNFLVSPSILQQVFRDEARIAVQNGVLAVAVGQILSQDSVIVAKTSLRICSKKPGGCTQCESLHLCKFYVLGTCVFGAKCKQPHLLTWPHNAELLRKFDLQHLSEKQLFQLLIQNDPYLLPEICSYYNMGEGESGLCKFTSGCLKLHICKAHFTTGVCKQGSSCSRNHGFDAMTHKSFEKFSPEMIKSLPKVYKNKYIIENHWNGPAAAGAAAAAAPVSVVRRPAGSMGATKPVSDSDTKEICLYFIKKFCAYKEKCVRVHWSLPYRWQVLDKDGLTWKDLTDMEEIEKAYCDPAKDSSSAGQPLSLTGFIRLKIFDFAGQSQASEVDFTSMTCNGSPVRRLSTASSVMKARHFILTTQWLWYWQEDIGKWHEFGQSQVNMPTALTSEALENAYLVDQKTQIPFTMGKHQYELYFKNEAGTPLMYQQNIKYSTKREVRRRPRFVSSNEVEVMRNSPRVVTAECPPHWDKTALPDIGYKFVLLPKSTEYNRIETLFKATMPKSRIQSVKRIQNPSLWTRFQLQREQMKKRNGGKPVIEEYLFHGTNENLIEAICEQNFDWRMNGSNGTAFGKGSYFAKQASYSNRYATASSSNKSMFVALVLVGDSIKGSSQYARPPAKSGSTTLYDSCVDDVKNPNIFVIFESHQIYPEYIINYSE
ncbi:protein mono-ADP-ribosyltransferase PARP12 isoform X1 [Syngnathus acus]|uniref:protein mono-ADP-ribosyltransferase PARP12 isoform X1 n=1 Tax=Syngnathus acus TaxID=161584 RepID=UPI001885E45F|nr:protein mono-ADP-ribosyltransferase PARP12 isoform X1 [Syngnathus acus]